VEQVVRSAGRRLTPNEVEVLMLAGRRLRQLNGAWAETR
jgi:hypothetical protein